MRLKEIAHAPCSVKMNRIKSLYIDLIFFISELDVADKTLSKVINTHSGSIWSIWKLRCNDRFLKSAMHVTNVKYVLLVYLLCPARFHYGRQHRRGILRNYQSSILKSNSSNNLMECTNVSIEKDNIEVKKFLKSISYCPITLFLVIKLYDERNWLKQKC